MGCSNTVFYVYLRKLSRNSGKFSRVESCETNLVFSICLIHLHQVTFFLALSIFIFLATRIVYAWHYDKQKVKKGWWLCKKNIFADSTKLDWLLNRENENRFGYWKSNTKTQKKSARNDSSLRTHEFMRFNIMI